jgi:hypothetical protein
LIKKSQPQIARSQSDRSTENLERVNDCGQLQRAAVTQPECSAHEVIDDPTQQNSLELLGSSELNIAEVVCQAAIQQ